jgi:hypothetical protein
MSEFSQMSGVRPQVKDSLTRAFNLSIEKPQKSFSSCLSNGFRQTVASIFAKNKITEHTMLSGHILETKQRAINSQSKWLIAAQDTTFYNYHSQDIEGMGTITGGIKGLAQHNVLLMSDTGLHLGLIHQQHWTRNGEQDFTQGQKESYKWSLGLSAVNTLLGDIDKRIVCVQDREADIFEFFKAERATNVDLLVRVCQPRNLEIVSNGQVQNLEETAKKIKTCGSLKTIIRENNKDVELTLEIRAEQINVHPNKDLSPNKHKTQGLALVVAREIERIDMKTQESIFDASSACCWYLITSMPIENEMDIYNVVLFYSMRWGVERFHYTLKSGALNVEKMQFDDIHTLINALVFYSIVAWQLLAITYIVRNNPDEVATIIFKQQEITVLEKISKKQIQTVKEAILAMCKITAGFAPTKKQPLPGVKVLAIAIQDFYYIKVGAGIA